MTNITPLEVKERLDAGETLHLVDVREPEETEEFDHLKNEEVIFYCRSGNRSGKAALFLEQLGFTNVKNLKGGMLEWREKFEE
jgi:rhodanese-related sulfurtransferase